MPLDKIKVCHVVTTLGVGGMENGIVNLCNGLNLAKFNPMICCLNSKGPMYSRLRSEVQIFDMGLPNVGRISNIAHVASFFKRTSPHIVHTHAWGGGSLYGILGARLAKVPIIINGEHGSFFANKYQILTQRFLFYLCSANLAVSESLKYKVNEVLSVPKDRITVIKNGVDTDLFSGKYSRQDIFRKLRNEGFPFDGDLFYIISVGSLKPEKSQMTLLKAVKNSTIRNNNVPVKILFVGDGPDRSLLSSFIVDNGLEGMVFILGNRSDVPELLSAADLMVSTSISRHEGLSNVLLEAMSSGVPVIATKSIGSDELIKDNINGYLINEYDASDLTKKIIYLIENPHERKRLSHNARSIINDNFTLDKMVDNYQKLYTRLLSR